MRPEIEEAMEIMYTFGKENCQVMDSGGKDSTVLKYIAELCRQKYGMPYSVHHNHTTIDAPETVYFVRQERDRIQAMGVPYTIHYPKETFGQLCLRKHMLPTRIVRFCCEELKESYGARERVCTGVRRAESVNRSKNQGIVTIIDGGKKQKEEINGNSSFMKTDKGGVVLLNYDNAEDVSLVYTCFRTNKVLVNPLINWTDDEVWRCINDNHLPINPLYGCGFWRVGCVGCPMAGDARYRDFERYPKYRDRYIWIADQIVKGVRERKKQSKITFKNGLEYFKNWIQNDDCIGQFAFDEDGNITEEWVI